ncbi:hypothetical protein BIY22_08900 [Vibrio panuliri]|uniref:Uncharacterized protein n=1 Tax=Vibrio panuliri TaxID=1381081 RepID=A0A1Q9HEW2_9VIBR|nr:MULTISPECIES: hypothetical protein [Vibrio]MBN8091087.1 hypothetical protein [Vibrio vulnificus]MBN8119689.1 hypothetical protein [Vibrio vulnificus]OLQ88272.1 hypothetical protein BIY22_08900 [Vibrio panuliri]
MKPEVYRICSNTNCELQNKEVLLEQAEDKWFYASPFCEKCHHGAALRWFYNGIEANSSEEFYAKVNGLAKEFHLLRKLIDKNAADSEDIERHKEILSKIDGLECTGCGQKLIHHEH